MSVGSLEAAALGWWKAASMRIRILQHLERLTTLQELHGGYPAPTRAAMFVSSNDPAAPYQLTGNLTSPAALACCLLVDNSKLYFNNRGVYFTVQEGS